jgi:hypothetical protein
MIPNTQIVADAQHCASLFRLGRDIEAALKMVEVIDAAMPLFTSLPADEQVAWTRILTAILECQERQDWIGLADWLDVEFVDMCNA